MMIRPRQVVQVELILLASELQEVNWPAPGKPVEGRGRVGPVDGLPIFVKDLGPPGDAQAGDPQADERDDFHNTKRKVDGVMSQELLKHQGTLHKKDYCQNERREKQVEAEIVGPDRVVARSNGCALKQKQYLIRMDLVSGCTGYTT